MMFRRLTVLNTFSTDNAIIKMLTHYKSMGIRQVLCLELKPLGSSTANLRQACATRNSVCLFEMAGNVSQLVEGLSSVH